MSNNELLLAISNMMDSKLKSELQPIKEELCSLRLEVQEIKADVRELQAEVQELQADMQVVKADIQELQAEVQELQDGYQKLGSDVHSIKLCQENIILPRLNTIEVCYTDTYKRYKNNTDKMESTFEDTELLKKVVAEHSLKLQKLA